MIWWPKPGMRVELRYGGKWREDDLLCWRHGKRGTVVRGGSGPGPINALVELDDGKQVVVPRGNLFEVKK